jgi:hypothetical protein
VIVVLGVIAGGAYLAYRATHPDAATATAPVQPARESPAAATAMPSIQHPIAQVPASASTAPLPALDDSDTSSAAALASLAGGDRLRGLLVSQRIIARIVATIDTLPRHELGTLMLPARTPKGDFVTSQGEAGTTMSERNFARYALYMQVVDSVDTKALVAWYVHAYPLFQEAYRQLGYPKGYFNDRLVVVIDNLLAAPDLARPASLVRSKSFYAYVDPSLESLSAGQKLLLRTGPANEAKLKAKLRAIRTELVGQKLPIAPSSSTSATPPAHAASTP